jgi:hypothetical protein
MQELSDPQIKSMIKAYSILTQFNMQGCAAIGPTGFFLTPGTFEISYSDPFVLCQLASQVFAASFGLMKLAGKLISHQILI